MFKLIILQLFLHFSVKLPNDVLWEALLVFRDQESCFLHWNWNYDRPKAAKLLIKLTYVEIATHNLKNYSFSCRLRSELTVLQQKMTLIEHSSFIPDVGTLISWKENGRLDFVVYKTCDCPELPAILFLSGLRRNIFCQKSIFCQNQTLYARSITSAPILTENVALRCRLLFSTLQRSLLHMFRLYFFHEDHNYFLSVHATKLLQPKSSPVKKVCFVWNKRPDFHHQFHHGVFTFYKPL